MQKKITSINIYEKYVKLLRRLRNKQMNECHAPAVEKEGETDTETYGQRVKEKKKKKKESKYFIFETDPLQLRIYKEN